MLRCNIDIQKEGGPIVTKSSPSWWDLPYAAMRLGLEAQTVIGLRLIKLSMGGPAAMAEAELMVSEKALTAIEAQYDFLTHAMAGQPHLAATRALALYNKKVSNNRRRLTKSI